MLGMPALGPKYLSLSFTIPCAPLLSLNGSMVIIAVAELLAYN